MQTEKNIHQTARSSFRNALFVGIPVLALCLGSAPCFAEELLKSEPSLSSSASFSATPEKFLKSEPSLSSSPSSTVAVPLVTITGSLFERGTGIPLPRVNIYCFPASRPETPVKITTDAAGSFFVEIPEGKLKWVISLSGYNSLELEDNQKVGGPVKPRLFYLEKKTYLPYETTVYGEVEKRDDKTRSLDQEQIATVPGANGDPVKAVQNLPGVNRPGVFMAQVIIEGSSPADTRYTLDNQSIPIVFHFGGFSSVVMSEAIDHVDYLSAGFGPEFGQSIAGYVNLTVKDPQTDRTHGFIYADTMNAGGMVEGPINDHSSYLFGMRQSYVGYILGSAMNDGNDYSVYTTVPEFRDIILEYKNQISVEDTFKLVAIGSQDTWGFLLNQPLDDPALRGAYNLNVKFFRIIPEWTRRFSPEVIGRFSLGMGKAWVSNEIADYYEHFDQTALSGRAEIEDQISNSWKSFFGADFQYFRINDQYQLPVVYGQGGISNPMGTGDLAVVSKSYETRSAGLYWRNVIYQQDSRWSFLPGIRVSYLNTTNEVLPEPRAGIRYALDHGLTLRAASGLYNQSPPAGALDKTYGNPELTSQRAVHTTAGFEKDFREGSASGWSLSSDFFYKHVYHLVARTTAMINPSRPQYYDNSGYGHIYGLEFMGKYTSAMWQGWIAYTLSRSRKGDALTPETISQYDQTHLLAAVAERKLGRNWLISARVRYTTGNPSTPIVGASYDVNSDVYVPLRGEIYSERIGDFFQADLRFDKKWVYDRWILTGYLDIENITNEKNIDSINYSYNYQKSEKVTGLPMYPSLGIKAEF